MFKKIVAFLMMTQLLIGSTLLPLGDFSLLNDLPKMYRAYEKVADPDERGILDFVGDYLLGGKDMLNHNQHDQPQDSGTMQFQHAATFAVVLQTFNLIPGQILSQPTAERTSVYLPGEPSDYHTTLFRPPLA